MGADDFGECCINDVLGVGVWDVKRGGDETRGERGRGEEKKGVQRKREREERPGKDKG